MQPDIKSHSNNNGGSEQKVGIQWEGSVARSTYWAITSFWLMQPKDGDCNWVITTEQLQHTTWL